MIESFSYDNPLQDNTTAHFETAIDGKEYILLVKKLIILLRNTAHFQALVNKRGLTAASGYFTPLTMKKQVGGKDYEVIMLENDTTIKCSNFDITNHLYVKLPFYLYPYELFNYFQYSPLKLSERNRRVVYLLISVITYKAKLIIFLRIIIPFLQFHKNVRFWFGVSINFTIYWSFLAAFLYYSFGIKLDSAYQVLSWALDFPLSFLGSVVRLFVRLFTYCFNVNFALFVAFICAVSILYKVHSEISCSYSKVNWSTQK